MLFAGVQNNVPDYMNAFDLFLLPSNFEGSPVTLVEAQGCGVPCLASTNVPGDGLGDRAGAFPAAQCPV